jgi:prepilin-type N-terminal cleavage/methylation domain-containing protein
MSQQPHLFRSENGFTLIEAIVASVILGVVALTLIQTMGMLSKDTEYSRERTAATGLAQEKLEQLKALDYYSLWVTHWTLPGTPPWFTVNGAEQYPYDAYYYTPETIGIGGTTYTRYVFVQEVNDVFSQYQTYLDWSKPDTGLKDIWVYVTWYKPNGVQQLVELSSLVKNPGQPPLDKLVWGTVTDSVTSQPLQSVTVSAVTNPLWNTATAADGTYGFYASGSSTNIQGILYGYNTYISTGLTLPLTAGTSIQWDFSMTPIATAIVAGYAMYNGSPVISQVCAKWSGPDDSQFVELYNPTTNTINIDSSTIQLQFVDNNNNVTIPKLSINTNLTGGPTFYSLSPYHYSLILGPDPGSGGTQTPAPDSNQADFTYDQSLGIKMDPTSPNGVILADGGGNPIDSVYWGDNTTNCGINNPNNPNPPDPLTINSAYGVSPGCIAVGPPAGSLSHSHTIIRKAALYSTASDMYTDLTSLLLGNAWNSYDTIADTTTQTFDFVEAGGPLHTRNSGIFSSTPTWGTVLPYAIIGSTDILSNSIQLSSNWTNYSIPLGFYSLAVATGSSSLTMIGSYGGWVGRIVPITTDLSATTFYYNILATTTMNAGIITGTVWGGARRAGGVLVQATGGYLGGPYQTSSQMGGSGRYALIVPEPGVVYNMTANPGYANPRWGIDSGYALPQPTYTRDFHVTPNAYITGRVTTPGNAGLPNIFITAAGAAANIYTGVTDSSGNYQITVSTTGNPYTLTPSLLTGSISNPATITGVNVTLGQTTSVGTFQISGAYMPITGTATLGGQPIGTGVLVMASTVTISAASPPVIDFSLRNKKPYYYQAFTDQNGNYELDVPGNNTYNVVAWYRTSTGTSTVITDTVNVPASGGATYYFTW